MRVSVAVRPKLGLYRDTGKILEGRRRSVKLWVRRHGRAGAGQMRGRRVGVDIAAARGVGGDGGVVVIRQLVGVGV